MCRKQIRSQLLRVPYLQYWHTVIMYISGWCVLWMALLCIFIITEHTLWHTYDVVYMRCTPQHLCLCKPQTHNEQKKSRANTLKESAKVLLVNILRCGGVCRRGYAVRMYVCYTYVYNVLSPFLTSFCHCFRFSTYRNSYRNKYIRIREGARALSTYGKIYISYTTTRLKIIQEIYVSGGLRNPSCKMAKK